MIKKHLLGVILLSLSTVCSAQSLTISTVDNTARNNTSTFNLLQGKVSFAGGQVNFITGNTSIANYLDYGVSGDRSLVAFLKGNNSKSSISLTNSLGGIVTSYEIFKLSPGDPSLAVYPANNGNLIVRENIANFNFYDSFGDLIKNLSGSSQSRGGESISEAVISPDSKSIFLYTPKIKRNGNLGSQIQYVDHTMNLKNLFFSNERYIKTLEVTDNGQFIIFVTSKDGTDDSIHISDRYGNDISVISTDENLEGVHLTEDAGLVTAYSGSRVLIFNTLSGERVAGTSFRSSVIAVNYFPQDNMILALTGNYNENSGAATGIDIHAIDVEQREVERKSYGSSIGFNEAVRHDFLRLGKNRYKLEGTSKHLEIRVSF